MIRQLQASMRTRKPLERNQNQEIFGAHESGWLPSQQEPAETIDVSSNGSCFYHALTLAITGLTTDAIRVRQALAKAAANSRVLRETCLGLTAADVKGMGDPGVWADEKHIYVAATVLNCTIAIYTNGSFAGDSDRPREWCFFHPNVDETQETAEKIYICHTHSGKHFEYVYRVSG